MPAKNHRRTPSFRNHKATGQGFVEIDGRRHYLGRYDLPKTRQEYHRLIAEYVANGYRLPVAPDEITIVELIDNFAEHAERYYRRPDGTHTSTLSNYKLVLRPLKRPYGSERVAEFGPRALKSVRQDMIHQGWSRGVVNQAVNLIRSVFRWGVAQEIVPVDVHTALASIPALSRGRSDARETDPVRPVPEAHVHAALTHHTNWRTLDSTVRNLPPKVERVTW